MITNHDLLDNLRGQVYHLQQKLIEEKKERDGFELRLVESFDEKHSLWHEIDDLKWRLEGFENNIEQAQKLLSGSKHVGKHVLCAAIDEIEDLRACLAAEKSACEELHKREVEYQQEIADLKARLEKAEAERDAYRNFAKEASKLCDIRSSKYEEAIRERDELLVLLDKEKSHSLSFCTQRNIANDRIARLVALLREEADRQTKAAYQGTGSWVDRVNREIGEKP